MQQIGCHKTDWLRYRGLFGAPPCRRRPRRDGSPQYPTLASVPHCKASAGLMTLCRSRGHPPGSRAESGVKMAAAQFCRHELPSMAHQQVGM